MSNSSKVVMWLLAALSLAWAIVWIVEVTTTDNPAVDKMAASLSCLALAQLQGMGA